jgi:nucleotide-binding universal stress UspA family protein
MRLNEPFFILFAMNVLVALDGSPRSERVLPHARDFARATGGELMLVRVLDPRIDCGGIVAPTLREAAAQVQARWTADLQALLAANGASGSVHVVLLKHGESLADAVRSAATALDAGIIAVDTRGAGALRHAFIGSLALDLVGNADRPVMVTGPTAQPPADPAPRPYRILATTDLSEGARAIGPLLAALTVLEGIAVRLVSIHVEGTSSGQPADTTAALEERRTRLGRESLETRMRVAASVEAVDDALLAEATDYGANVILQSTQGHSKTRHLFAGSIALRVVNEATIPVILVRHAT